MSDQLGRVFLGVDGGNSGTRALLVNAEAKILGAGHGGNANYSGQGYPSAVANVMQAVHEGVQEAGIGIKDVARIYFALAGDDVEDDDRALTALLAAATEGVPFDLANDVWAGLRAGSLGGFGIAVNCGSGCGAVGRRPDGSGIKIPDLGYVFGDSGGGVQIGVDAIRAVVRAWDGRGCPTALTGAVLDLMGYSSTDELYVAMHRHTVDTEVVRKCTRLVFRIAASGDEVALSILQRIGDELGVAAAAIARRLGMTDLVFPFVLTGGSFRTLKSPLVQAAVARLRTVAPHCVPTLPRLMPVAGAALLALDSAGVEVTPNHFEILAEQGQQWHPEESFTDQNGE